MSLTLFYLFDFSPHLSNITLSSEYFTIVKDSIGRVNRCSSAVCSCKKEGTSKVSNNNNNKYILSLERAVRICLALPKKITRHDVMETATLIRRISTCHDEGWEWGPLPMSRSPSTAGGENWYTWTSMTWFCHIENLGTTVVWAPRHACPTTTTDI